MSRGWPIRTGKQRSFRSKAPPGARKAAIGCALQHAQNEHRLCRKTYEHCLDLTSMEQAPWYVVHADDKDNTRLIVLQILVIETLEAGVQPHNPSPPWLPNRFTHLLKRMYFNGLCPDRISENRKVNLFISLGCSSDILLKTTLPKNRFDPEMRCVHMLAPWERVGAQRRGEGLQSLRIGRCTIQYPFKINIARPSPGCFATTLSQGARVSPCT